MVHALSECRRVLKPGGLMVDLRPYDGVWPLEVVGDGDASIVGALDYSLDSPDDLAADAAINEARRRGWFRTERIGTFKFAWYWDSFTELETYLAERPTRVQVMLDSSREAVEKALKLAGPGSRLRILRRMVIGRYVRTRDVDRRRQLAHAHIRISYGETFSDPIA